RREPRVAARRARSGRIGARASAPSPGRPSSGAARRRLRGTLSSGVVEALEVLRARSRPSCDVRAGTPRTELRSTPIRRQRRFHDVRSVYLQQIELDEWRIHGYQRITRLRFCDRSFAGAIKCRTVRVVADGELEVEELSADG